MDIEGQITVFDTHELTYILFIFIPIEYNIVADEYY